MFITKYSINKSALFYLVPRAIKMNRVLCCRRVRHKLRTGPYFPLGILVLLRENRFFFGYIINSFIDEACCLKQNLTIFSRLEYFHGSALFASSSTITSLFDSFGWIEFYDGCDKNGCPKVRLSSSLKIHDRRSLITKVVNKRTERKQKKTLGRM